MTWRERIVAARERGTFTDEERLLSGTRATCAVGEQHILHPHVVPQFECGRFDNRDPQLHELGYAFDMSVKDGTVILAEALLDQIEDRALELKRESITP